MKNIEFWETALAVAVQKVPVTIEQLYTANFENVDAVFLDYSDWSKIIEERRADIFSSTETDKEKVKLGCIGKINGIPVYTNAFTHPLNRHKVGSFLLKRK